VSVQILYGFPLPADKIGDLLTLQFRVENITVMIDCIAQVKALEEYTQTNRSPPKPLQAYIKVNQGGA
jgi:D-serine deaminase-like pyridoxal phosphate-dependent protein